MTREERAGGSASLEGSVCRACRAETDPGRPFCSHCGEPLAERTSRAPDERFCVECGRPLPSAPGSPDARPLRGERRNVTVLFADLSGFTAMSEKLDPEDLANVVNRCFETLARPIVRRGGTIDKFIGDCVMALFGAPLAHEDDARHAARAALELMNALVELRPSLPAVLSLTVGINTGPVLAGYVGTEARRDYTVMGDVVNVAKRLQEAASPGEILIGERTAQQLEGAFQLEPMAPVRAKGKTEPLRAFRVVAERGLAAASASPAGMGFRYLPQLVGRDGEWKRLLAAVEQVEGGRGQAVVVTGAAGIGKSRLKLQLRQEVERRGWSVREGWADLGAPLAAFSDLLRAWLDKLAVKEGGDRRRQIVELGRRHGLARAELTRLMHYVVGTGPAGLVNDAADGRRQFELFGAFRKLLTPAEGSGPDLVILEDWQMADEQSQDLFEFLARHVSERQVLLVAVARTKETPLRVPPGTLQLSLGPLSERDMDTLLSQIVPAETVPAALRQRLAQKSEGNPLFLLQLLQSWAGAGLLQPLGDRYRFTGKTEEPELPDSLQAMVAARVDRLPAELRAMLLRAAVLGNAFPWQVLARMEERATGSAPEVVAARLEALHEQNLLHRSPSSDRISFTSTLVTDVAQATLLRADAREAHRLAAEAYESRVDLALPIPPVVLYKHWIAAGEERRALPYLIAAADLSRAAFDQRRAVDEYRSALSILERDERTQSTRVRGDVLQRLGDAQLQGGDYYDALVTLCAARAVREELGDNATATEAGCLKLLAVACQKLGRYDEAIELCEEGIRATAREDPLLAASLEAVAALTCCYAGRFALAEEWVQRGLGRLDATATQMTAQRSQVRAMLLRAQGNALVGTGKSTEAIAAYEAGRLICEQLGDRLEHSIALYNLGEAHAQHGDHAAAALYYGRAIAEKTEIGDRWGLAYTYHGLACLAAGEGNDARALADGERGLALARELADRKLVAMLSCLVGRLRFAMGEADQAERCFLAAADDAREIGAVPEQIQANLGLSAIYRERGKLVLAVGAAQRARDLAERAGISRMFAEALVASGRAYSAGHREDAYRCFQAALEVAAKTGHAGLRFDVLLALAEFHLAHAEYEACLSVLEDVRVGADPVGDRPHRAAADLARAEVHFRRGENDQALALARTALDELRAVGTVTDVARVHGLLAHIFTHTTRYAEAEGHARTAIELLESQRSQSLRDLGRAYLTLGYVCYEDLHPERMKESFDKGLEILQRYGDPAELAAGHRAVAVALTREEPEQAVTLLERSLAAARQAGNVLAEAEALGDLGEVHRRMGRLDLALDAFREEGVLVERIGYERGKAISAFHQATAYHATGQISLAMEAVDKNVWTSERVGNIGLLYGLEFRGMVRTELGRFAEAREDLDRALELALRIQHAERLANIRRTRAEHLLLCGQLDAAEHEVRLGAESASRLTDDSVKEYGYLVRERLVVMSARIALARKRYDRASELIHAPLAVFERLQAPIPELEALLVLGEARALSGITMGTGRSIRDAAQKGRTLGLTTAYCDALYLMAAVTGSGDAAQKGYDLALRIGTPLRIARFAWIAAMHKEAGGDRAGAEGERAVARKIIDELSERLPAADRAAARALFLPSAAEGRRYHR